MDPFRGPVLWPSIASFGLVGLLAVAFSSHADQLFRREHLQQHSQGPCKAGSGTIGGFFLGGEVNNTKVSTRVENYEAPLVHMNACKQKTREAQRAHAYAELQKSQHKPNKAQK